MSLQGDLVGLANELTQSFGLQPLIGYRQFLKADGAGKKTYVTAYPIQRRALYTRKMKQIRTFAGEMAVSNAQVVFLDSTTVNEFDEITLPDGTIQPILGTDAFVDASQGPILTEIFLG